MSESKQDLKGNEKNKGKWAKKRGYPQETNDKENVAPHKKFNATDRGHVSQTKEHDKGDGRIHLICWTCGGENIRIYFPQHQGGRPQIYSVQEAQTVGNIGQIIPWIYVAVDSRQADHKESIIEMKVIFLTKLFIF